MSSAAQAGRVPTTEPSLSHPWHRPTGLVPLVGGRTADSAMLRPPRPVKPSAPPRGQPGSAPQAGGPALAPRLALSGRPQLASGQRLCRAGLGPAPTSGCRPAGRRGCSRGCGGCGASGGAANSAPQELLQLWQGERGRGRWPEEGWAPGPEIGG